MRFGGTQNNNSINIVELNEQIESLKDIFDYVMVINPVTNSIVELDNYRFDETPRKCTSVCPMIKDSCGCICKDIASNNEKRCRFTYDKSNAYFIIGQPLKTKYKEFILILIMKLDTSFSFGALSEVDAIEHITKISSNLVVDPLTKIFNRKYLMDNIDYMIKDCQSKNTNLCLACIDVDNFKKFNDSYGHEFGDLVLKKIADLMSESIQMLKEAYPIRIGGDEFVIVAVGVDKNRFKAIMSKLCIMVDDTKLPYGNQKVGIKISIGVSELLSDKVNNYKELYAKADTQLYKAKEAGKGCVR